MMNIDENTRVTTTIRFESITFSQNTHIISTHEDLRTDNGTTLSIQNHLEVTSYNANNNITIDILLYISIKLTND